MKVYEKNKSFIVDIEDGSKKIVINRLHGRFHFIEDTTVIKDEMYEKRYTATTAQLKDEAGAIIGNEDAVIDYLTVFIGS